MTPPATRPTGRRWPGWLAQWPLALVLLVVAAGLVLAGMGYVRRGPALIGAGALLAAGLRLVLPDRLAGLLAVRRKGFDVALLALGGAAALVLTLSISPRS